MADQDSASSPPGPSTSKDIRISRNVAEKHRRDKLNGYISELASIVPMVSMSSRRLDKTSILRLSAAHLRISKSPLSGLKKAKRFFKWCPSFLTESQIQGLLESIDGFLMVTTSSGKILFVSRTVEQQLGHQNIDMIGHSLFFFIHPEDADGVKEKIERLLTSTLEKGSSVAPRCSFYCRIREKSQPRSEVTTYREVYIRGDMSVTEVESPSIKNLETSNEVGYHMFKAFVKIVESNPYNQFSLDEALADEYVTRHSLDGTIIFADHRLSPITGHMPTEVLGLSAYKYIHQDDITLTQFAQHLMFSSDKGTGIIVYRLRTRDDKYVYLKSVGTLQFDSSSNVDHFVCVNQYLNDAEGAMQLKYFVDRFIPHIKNSNANSFLDSIKSLQAPQTKMSTLQSKGELSHSLMSATSTTVIDFSVSAESLQCSPIESQKENLNTNMQKVSSPQSVASDSKHTGANSRNTLPSKENVYFSKVDMTSSSIDCDRIVCTANTNPSMKTYSECNRVQFVAVSNCKSRQILGYIEKNHELYDSKSSSDSSYLSERSCFSVLADENRPSVCPQLDLTLAFPPEKPISTNVDAYTYCSSGSSIIENSDSCDPDSDSVSCRDLVRNATLGQSVEDSSSSISIAGQEDSQGSLLKTTFWPDEGGMDLKSLDVSNSSLVSGDDLTYTDRLDCTLPFQEDLHSLLGASLSNDGILLPQTKPSDVFGSADGNMSFECDVSLEEKNS